MATTASSIASSVDEAVGLVEGCGGSCERGARHRGRHGSRGGVSLRRVPPQRLLARVGAPSDERRLRVRAAQAPKSAADRAAPSVAPTHSADSKHKVRLFTVGGDTPALVDFIVCRGGLRDDGRATVLHGMTARIGRLYCVPGWARGRATLRTPRHDRPPPH